MKIINIKDVEVKEIEGGRYSFMSLVTVILSESLHHSACIDVQVLSCHFVGIF